MNETYNDQGGFNPCIMCGKKPSPVKGVLFWRAQCCGRSVERGGGFETLIKAWNAQNKKSGKERDK